MTATKMMATNHESDGHMVAVTATVMTWDVKRHGIWHKDTIRHDTRSPPKNWYQNLVLETWVQVMHTRHTRGWYQNAWHTSSFWYDILVPVLGRRTWVVCHGP